MHRLKPLRQDQERTREERTDNVIVIKMSSPLDGMFKNENNINNEIRINWDVVVIEKASTLVKTELIFHKAESLKIT